MKKTNWAVVQVCLVVPCLMLCHLVLILVDAQDEGTIFVDQKEEDVKQIALSVGMLDGNCTLLDTCQYECTRAVCYPLTEDLQAECVRVDLNDICPPTGVNNSCDLYMKLNYQRSYLTLPPPADPELLTPEMTRDICLQRALDTTFKAISSDKEFSYVYFGSLSGVFRAFPGRERPANQCTMFETRVRPWFKNGNSVQKQLRILVDTGNSMGSPVGANYPPAAGATFLEVASNIILQLLKTVSPDDFVDVGTFNSSGHHQLSPMVIVVFTDGQFSPVDATTFPTAQILELKAKIILYKLPPTYDPDPFLSQTTLRNVLCDAKGTFELLEPYTTSNPLFSIRSFYTFLAQIHLAVAKNQSTWSSTYQGASQALNETTVTYPAFGKDGQLIGVAGIDVFPEELDGNLGDLVLIALNNRSALGYLPGTYADINLTCSYQTQAISEENCSASAPNGGICEATDATSLQQRVCCDGCLATPPTGGPDLSKVLPAVFGSLAGGVILLTCFLCLIFPDQCKKLLNRREDPPIPPFPGSFRREAPGPRTVDDDPMSLPPAPSGDDVPS